MFGGDATNITATARVTMGDRATISFESGYAWIAGAVTGGGLIVKAPVAVVQTATTNAPADADNNNNGRAAANMLPSSNPSVSAGALASNVGVSSSSASASSMPSSRISLGTLEIQGGVLSVQSPGALEVARVLAWRTGMIQGGLNTLPTSTLHFACFPHSQTVLLFFPAFLTISGKLILLSTPSPRARAHARLGANNNNNNNNAGGSSAVVDPSSLCHIRLGSASKLDITDSLSTKVLKQCQLTIGQGANVTLAPSIVLLMHLNARIVVAPGATFEMVHGDALMGDSSFSALVVQQGGLLRLKPSAEVCLAFSEDSILLG